MAKNLCRLPPEWCNYISQLCQQFDDKQPSPPSRITFGDCPQRLESYVQTPLMYLMPPIILWSPLEQFPMMKTKLCTCPKCNSGEVILHPSTWRDGTKSRRSEPRKVYGEDGVTLLVGRVYTCSKGHEVIGYHPSILEKIPACFIPFDLWHITGFTRKASLSIISLITSGISIHGIYFFKSRLLGIAVSETNIWNYVEEMPVVSLLCPPGNSAFHLPFHHSML